MPGVADANAETNLGTRGDKDRCICCVTRPVLRQKSGLSQGALLNELVRFQTPSAVRLSRPS
jgi:hypothetical protein